MNEMEKCNFLRRRMIELRQANHKSISQMAALIGCDKSTLSRVEKIDGNTSYNNIERTARDYCKKLGMNQEQTEQLLRGKKIVVPDTSALLKNDQLIDDLCEQYFYVVIPDIVVNELDYIKNHDKDLAAKAWRILQSITNNSPDKGGNAICRAYIKGDNDDNLNNDQKIINVARAAAEEFLGEVDIISYDTGFSARLSGDTGQVKSIFLLDYLAKRQKLSDMQAISKIDDYYADSYDDMEKILGIKTPNAYELNAYLENGYTLIISTVRNKKAPFNQRREKIRWLIEHGADVNQRDFKNNYFPALSHCVQIRDFEMFKFLLHECGADPNVGSRNPYDSGKFQRQDRAINKKTEDKKSENEQEGKKEQKDRQIKNDGNMPLMIAAWDNKLEFVEELLKDKRTSINQQDGNGFTALIKASYWGWLDCRNALIAAGADTKIVDRDGFTADDRYNEFLETGRRKYDRYPKRPNRNRKEWHNK